MERHSTLKVALTTVYVAALLVANVVTGKQVALPFGLSMTAGCVVFPVTYVLSDVFSECYGFGWSRKTCHLAFVAQAMAVVMYMAAVALPPAPFYDGQEAFASVLGSTPRVALASLAAFFCGDFVNDLVFRRMRESRKDGKRFGLRAVASSVAGEIADTAVFMPLVFVGTMPPSAIVAASACELAAKLLVEVAALPVTYGVRAFVSRSEGV